VAPSAREEISAPYRDTRYETILGLEGSFLDEDEKGIKIDSETLCQDLLENDQAVPQDFLFRDDRFKATCQMVRARNELTVFHYITPEIVPSAESLRIRGANHLHILVELINEIWTNSKPIVGTFP
jgi:hypothetical protein